MAQEVLFDSGLSFECNPKINNQLTSASVASLLSLPPGHDINSATTVTARGSRSGAEPTAHGSIGAWSSPKSNSESILCTFLSGSLPHHHFSSSLFTPVLPNPPLSQCVSVNFSTFPRPCFRATKKEAPQHERGLRWSRRYGIRMAVVGIDGDSGSGDWQQSEGGDCVDGIDAIEATLLIRLQSKLGDDGGGDDGWEGAAC